MTKVALQLSGLLRYNQKCIDTLKWAIIDELNPDIFCSFWESEKTHDYITQLNPKLVEIENYDHILPNFESMFTVPVYRTLLPMIYKFYRVNSLKQSYELANNFKYSFVIQARPDGQYFQKFPVDQMQECINQHKIKMTLVYSPNIDPYISPRIADTLFVGDNHSMNSVASVFWMLRDQAEENNKNGLYNYNQIAEIIQSQCWQKLGVRWDVLQGSGIEGNFNWDLDPTRHSR